MITFICHFCGKEYETNQLGGIVTKKIETEQIKKLKKQEEDKQKNLYFRLLELEEKDYLLKKPFFEKQINEVNERIKKLYTNIQISKQNACLNCFREWRKTKVKEGNIQTFTCDICQKERTGEVQRMKVDAPFMEPPIPKTKLCQVCSYCKNNVKEVNEYEINPPKREEFS